MPILRINVPRLYEFRGEALTQLPKLADLLGGNGIFEENIITEKK